jgi:CBS domain-containing protein
MRTTLKTILERKGPQVHAVSPSHTVLDAVRRMNQERVGAVLIMDGQETVGIFTERDVLSRVVDQNRDPASTKVSEVMTREMVTVKPGTTVEEAMAIVTDKRCRHLPVMEGKVLLGVVSSGDLTRSISEKQEVHIQDLVNYITSKYPK